MYIFQEHQTLKSFPLLSPQQFANSNLFFLFIKDWHTILIVCFVLFILSMTQVSSCCHLLYNVISSFLISLVLFFSVICSLSKL